jgi:fumarate reductase flavoprotein subunit
MTAILPTETDVLVVGAGLAGICAAIEAATNGASVLLLEKMPRPGGSSRMSSGFFAFSGTEDQCTANVDDSNERFYNDLRRVGGNANDTSLLRTFIDHQLDGYRWLKALGVTFDTVRATSGQSVPRTHQTVAVRLFDLLDPVPSRHRSGSVGTCRRASGIGMYMQRCSDPGAPRCDTGQRRVLAE